MEQIKSSSEQLLSALSNMPYFYLPEGVFEAMRALRQALTGSDFAITKQAQVLVKSLNRGTNAVPHNIATYVEDLSRALAA